MAVAQYSAYNPFTDTLRLPSRTFSLCDRKIVVWQDWGEDGRGGTEIGFGAGVQDAAIALAQYVEFRRDDVKGRTVIELGAGPGLVGYAAMMAGASRVCVTDGDLPLVEALTVKNASENFALCPSSTSSSSPTTTTTTAAISSSNHGAEVRDHDEVARQRAVRSNWTCGRRERHWHMKRGEAGEKSAKESAIAKFKREREARRRLEKDSNVDIRNRNDTDTLPQLCITGGEELGGVQKKRVEEDEKEEESIMWVEQLLWGNDTHHDHLSNLSKEWDIILAADIVGLVYSDYFAHLAKTIDIFFDKFSEEDALENESHFSEREGCERRSVRGREKEMWLSYRQRHHTETAFFTMIKKKGYRVERVDDFQPRGEREGILDELRISIYIIRAPPAEHVERQ